MRPALILEAGGIKRYTQSVHPSVCRSVSASCAYDFLKIGKPQNLVEIMSFDKSNRKTKFKLKR